VRGRRAALAAGAAVLAVTVSALFVWDDIAAWFVGYRFVWVPEELDPRWGKSSLNAAGELLVTETDSAPRPRGGIWSARSEKVSFIELPPGAQGVVRPFAINNRGLVLGEVRSLDGMQPNRPFLWRAESGMQLLPAPGEGDTWFNDINDRDEAVGSFEVGPPVPIKVIVYRAVFWTPDGGFRVLDGLTPQATETTANSFNKSGWIAGVAIGNDRRRHPVLWISPDQPPQDLGFPQGFDGGAAVDLNDRGTVLVNLWQETGAGGGWENTRPFLWTQERGFSAILVPDGYTTTIGVAMDQRDGVLLHASRGSGRDREERSFLVRDGTIHELPAPRGALEVEYHALSDRGWLIGTARLSEGPDGRRGFVAIPVR